MRSWFKDPKRLSMHQHLLHKKELMIGIFIVQLCPKVEVLKFIHRLALFSLQNQYRQLANLIKLLH